ncbi:hypothetical protein [Halobacterium rubrum]|uniref:hypothetical protein n=1 Tax=Halobacterium TaxID=2239 RepID=UPI001F1B689B|nr:MULTISPECIES: hypothetical protein [Halobacterium]MDH5021618.1 hypothetical protein [Halobacterium rubrum]
MKRLTAGLLVAVALLTVSGCTALPGVGGDVDPPGVEDGELANETALVEAHLDERGDSYEVQTTHEETAGNTTSSDEMRVVVADGDTFVHRETTTKDDATSVYESLSTDSFTASKLPDGTFSIGSRYSAGSAHGIPSQFDLLRLADFQTAGTTTHDGDRVARLRASSLTDDADVSFELQRATLLVGDEGLVHELDYRLTDYAATDDFQYTVTLASTSVDSLPAPDWTSDAREELPDADIDVSTNSEGYVVIEHAGGDAFDARLRVDRQLLTHEDFQPGEKLYVGEKRGSYDVATMWTGDPVDGEVTVTVTGVVSPERATVNADG